MTSQSDPSPALTNACTTASAGTSWEDRRDGAKVKSARTTPAPDKTLRHARPVRDLLAVSDHRSVSIRIGVSVSGMDPTKANFGNASPQPVAEQRFVSYVGSVQEFK